MAKQSYEDNRNRLAKIQMIGEKMFQIIIGQVEQQLVKKSPIVGTIFIVVDEVPFPSENWSDFPVTVLTAWTKEVGRAISETKKGVFFFFDGPFLIKFEGCGNQLEMYGTSYEEGLELSCIPEEKKGLYFNLCLYDFLTELKEAIDKLFVCIKGKASVREYFDLRRAKKEIRLLINNFDSEDRQRVKLY